MENRNDSWEFSKYLRKNTDCRVMSYWIRGDARRDSNWKIKISNLYWLLSAKNHRVMMIDFSYIKFIEHIFFSFVFKVYLKRRNHNPRKIIFLLPREGGELFIACLYFSFLRSLLLSAALLWVYSGKNDICARDKKGDSIRR